MLWAETLIARRRVNQQIALDAVVLHSTLASVVSAVMPGKGKKGDGFKQFQKLIKDLCDG